MTVLDIAKTVLGAIWPPDHDEDPRHWRRAVFVMLITLMALISFHITAAKGFLTGIGIHGFASSQVVEEISEKQNSVLYAIYAPQIRAKIAERCRASTEQKEHINQELDLLLREYKRATGKDFSPIPRCDEV